MTDISKRPWFAAGLTVIVYVAVLVPMAASRHNDLSVFVMGGDRYVTPSRTVAPIAVMPHSLGYDGQFFYRLALNPFSAERSAYGILLDSPAKRMLRIVYPLLAWLVSLGGRPWLVPASLVAVNLFGMGAIAAITTWIARRHGLAWWMPFAIVTWPGFLVALTHDTAEIITAALLLASLACYMSDRLVAYCLLAAATLLTRETAAPVLFGVLAYEAHVFATSPAATRRPQRVLLAGAAFVPVSAWWLILRAIWHESPHSLGGNQDVGWPLAGMVTMLRAAIDGSRIYNPDPAANVTTRGFVVLTTCVLIAFCITVVCRVPRLLRTPGWAGMATGWLLVTALMSLLTAGGPWVEPLSYARAFTECWVVGCLLLATPPAPGMGRKRLTVAALLLGVEVNVVIWKWSLWLLTR